MQQSPKGENTIPKKNAGEILNAAPSHTSMNVEQQDKPNSSNQLITYEQLDGPFTLAIKEEGCCILCGKYRLTEWIDEITCREKVINKDWDLITALISIVADEKLTEIGKKLFMLESQLSKV